MPTTLTLKLRRLNCRQKNLSRDTLHCNLKLFLYKFLGVVTAKVPGKPKVGGPKILQLFSLLLKAAYQLTVRVRERRMCCFKWAAGEPAMSTWACVCVCISAGPALCYFCTWGVPTASFFCVHEGLLCFADVTLSLARRGWSAGSSLVGA